MSKSVRKERHVDDIFDEKSLSATWSAGDIVSDIDFSRYKPNIPKDVADEIQFLQGKFGIRLAFRSHVPKHITEFAQDYVENHSRSLGSKQEAELNKCRQLDIEIFQGVNLLTRWPVALYSAFSKIDAETAIAQLIGYIRKKGCRNPDGTTCIPAHKSCPELKMKLNLMGI